MKQEIAKEQRCVLMRSGTRIWMDADRARKLQEVLNDLKQHKFIWIDDETVNTADVEGVYRAATLEEMVRRKNGEWQCQKGTWHKKFSECGCRGEDTTCQTCNVSPCVC